MTMGCRSTFWSQAALSRRKSPPVLAQYKLSADQFVANKGAPYAVTRNSIEGAMDANGIWRQADVNQPLVLPGLGLAIFAARTNRIKCNQRTSGGDGTLLGIGGVGSAGWTLRGTAAVDPAGQTAPDGSNTAELITGLGAVTVNDIYQTNSGFTNNASLAVGVWIKKVTATGTLKVANAQSGTLGTWTVDISTVPADTWVRLTASSSYVTVNNAFTAKSDGSGGFQLYCPTGAPISFYIWRPWQVEAPAAGPDYEVGNVASYAVPATVVSAPLPVYSGTGFATKAVFTIPVAMPGGTAWEMGTFGAANTAALHINATGGTTYAKAWGSDGTVREGYWTHGWVANSRHTVVMAPNPAGGIATVFADGALKTLTDAGGAGTGTMTAFPSGTLYIGQRSTGVQLNGYLEEFSIYATSDPSRVP